MGQSNELLVGLAQDGDEDALAELLELNMGLIYKAGAQFEGATYLTNEDLAQEASIAFVSAVFTYDPDRGAKLSTYAWYVMLREVSHIVRDSSDVGLSAYAYEGLMKYEMTHDVLYQRMKRTPTVDEIADEMGLSTNQVRTLRRVFREVGNIASFDREFDEADIDGEEEREVDTLHDTVSSNTNLEEEYMKKELIVQALEGVNDLPDEQREVIQLRYFEDYTWEEIEDKMQISRRTAVRREREALDALGLLLQV